MGKSGEGRGLFRRRSTPPVQDPTIDITSVLSVYGRSAAATTLEADAPAPTVVETVAALDDDTVRYGLAAEPAAAVDDDVVDLTDARPEVLEEPAALVDDAGTPAHEEPAPADQPEHEVVAAEDVAAAEVLGEDAQHGGTGPDAVETVEAADGGHPAEPVFAAVGREIPPPAGWWEESTPGWGPADHDQIDAVVHDSLPTGEADAAPVPLSPEEAYGRPEDTATISALEEPPTIAWAVAEAGDAAEAAEVLTEEAAVEAAAPAAWWQALQTDDLGGLPVAGPEQHDEQHAHHHEAQDEAVTLAERLAPLDAAATDERPWWQSLQDPAHDVSPDADVVDLRDEPLSEDPEAVAARLARLRDAGLLSDEEYAAETAGLLSDRG